LTIALSVFLRFTPRITWVWCRLLMVFVLPNL
jgi:hypothetical protein